MYVCYSLSAAQTSEDVHSINATDLVRIAKDGHTHQVICMSCRYVCLSFCLSVCMYVAKEKNLIRNDKGAQKYEKRSIAFPKTKFLYVLTSRVSFSPLKFLHSIVFFKVIFEPLSGFFPFLCF